MRIQGHLSVLSLSGKNGILEQVMEGPLLMCNWERRKK
jgi:hypothetical protein